MDTIKTFAKASNDERMLSRRIIERHIDSRSHDLKSLPGSIEGLRRIAVKFFIVLLCAPLTSFCQHFVPTLAIEKTVAGSEYGASVSYQTKRFFSVGAFYQRGLPHKTNDTQSHRNFTGLLLNIPIADSPNINFYVQSRFGFVDETFFVFVPGVETEMRLVRDVWIHAGAGLRMTHPSLTTKISIKL